MMNVPEDLFDYKKVIKALQYGLEGVIFALKNERAFRQEILIFAPLAFIAIWISNSWQDYFLLVAPLFVILALELVNTAIEQLANLISQDTCHEIKIVKDCAAGAVLLMVILTSLIWLVRLSSFL